LNAFAVSAATRELSGTVYRETFWLVTDHLGTPRMVVDKSGSLASIKRHDYLPFGEELGAGVGGRTTTQGYTTDNLRQKFGGGQERDSETGLDFMQARYYSSTMGRFTSADSLAGRVVNPQTLNLYSYVRNNPLRYVDPTGHQTVDHCTGSNNETCGRPVQEHLTNYIEKDEEIEVINSNAKGERPTLWQEGFLALKLGVRNGLDPHFLDRKFYGISDATIQYYEREKHHTTMALLPLAFAAVPEFAAEDAAADISAAVTGDIDAALESTVYHGTDSASAESVISEGLSVTRNNEAAAGAGADQNGFFVTTEKSIAQDYANVRAADRGGEPVVLEAPKGRLPLETHRNLPSHESFVPRHRFKDVGPRVFRRSN
jgi:RHS repeat-associated protein